MHEATALANVKFSRNHGQDRRARTNELRTTGTDAAAGGGARGRCAQVRGAERRRVRPVRTRGRAGQDRGRSARATRQPANTQRSVGGAGPPGTGGDGVRRDRVALRRLLRGSQRRRRSSRCASGSSRSSATAAGSGHGSTSTTRAAATRARGRARGAARSTTWSTTTQLPVQRVAAGARRGAGREAAAALPDLARAAGGRRGGRGAVRPSARGASNAKAKRELGWTPRHPSWRDGFPAAYSAISVADQPTSRPATRTGRSLGEL